MSAHWQNSMSYITKIVTSNYSTDIFLSRKHPTTVRTFSYPIKKKKCCNTKRGYCKKGYYKKGYYKKGQRFITAFLPSLFRLLLQIGISASINVWPKSAVYALYLIIATGSANLFLCLILSPQAPLLSCKIIGITFHCHYFFKRNTLKNFHLHFIFDPEERIDCKH